MRRSAALLATLVLTSWPLTAAGVTASAVWFALDPPRRRPRSSSSSAATWAPDNRLGAQTIQAVEPASPSSRQAPHPASTSPAAARAGEPGAGEQMRTLAVSLGVPAAATTAESLALHAAERPLLPPRPRPPRRPPGHPRHRRLPPRPLLGQLPLGRLRPGRPRRRQRLRPARSATVRWLAREALAGGSTSRASAPTRSSPSPAAPPPWTCSE